MNINLYVIQGGENYGKTTTCWKLLNKLKPIVACFNYWKTSDSDKTIYDAKSDMYVIPKNNKEGKENQPVDFVVVARLNNPANCKVAIISAGDEDDYLKRKIYEFLADDVHHIVCCERLIKRKGSTNCMLQHEFGRPYKYEKSIKDRRNSLEEDRIADEIYSLLSTISQL